MATPALAALRARFPAARIVLGGRRRLRDLAEGLGVSDGWIDVDGGALSVAASLRAERFDLAVALPRSFRAALEPFLAGIPARIGHRGQGRSLLLTTSFAPLRDGSGRQAPRYGGDVYLHLIESAGVPIPSRRVFLGETDAGRRGAEEILAPGGKPAARPWILLVPGAAFGSAKCWPAPHFAELGKALLSRRGGTVWLLSGPGEEEHARAIAREIGPGARAPAPSEAPLSVLASLVARADLVVTNDTGPRHVAVAFDRPGVALVGPMDPRYTESTQGRLAVLREQVPCSPCNLRRCPIDHRCMTRITPERVLAEAEKALDPHRA